jgi:hypothetical protein
MVDKPNCENIHIVIIVIWVENAKENVSFILFSISNQKL